MLARTLVLSLMGMAAIAAVPAQGQSSFGNPAVIVVEADETGYQTISGTVIPFREVTFTAQSPGRVMEIAGAEGDYFEAGEVLARVADERLQAQRRAALAEMRSAEAALREAQVQYGREAEEPKSEDVGQMPGMGLPSVFDQLITRPGASMIGLGDPELQRRTDLYSRYIGVEQTRARWEQARARVDELDVAIRDTRSEAPFDGLILHKHATEGDTVQPGTPLITFGHVDYLRVEAEVPVRLVVHLSEGQMVPVELDTGDEVDARVARIFPLANPQRHTVTVKFDLPQGVRGGPGMHATVNLPNPEAASGRVVIPRSALIPGGALPRVAVVGPDGEVRVRMVRLGNSRGDDIVVTSGLEEGMQILARPGTRLRQSPGTRWDRM